MYRDGFLHFFIFLFVFIVISCGDEEIQSEWMKAPIIVDGISADWADYPQIYNEDWKTIYSIINDDTSLSVLIQFRDYRLARKINTRGLTLWLNSEGEKEKNLGIHYEDRKLMDKILNMENVF